MSLDEEPRLGEGDEFEVRTRSDRGGYLIEPCGDLDLATRDKLIAALAEAFESDAQRIVLDLRRLAFIDSSGVHTIVQAARTAQERHKQLVLRRGSPVIQRIFEVAGIVGRLPFAD